MNQAAEFRGLRPCGATMLAARSDQAATAASPKRSCPYPRRTKQAPCQTSVFHQTRWWVLCRRFSNATTSRFAPALCDADRSVLRLSFARIRVDRKRHPSQQSMPQAPQCRSLTLDRVEAKWRDRVAMRSSRPSLYRRLTWGPCFAERFADLRQSVRSGSRCAPLGSGRMIVTASNLDSA